MDGSEDSPPTTAVASLLLALWSTAVGLCLVLGTLGGAHWGLDLLSHFQVQYAGLAVAGLVVAILGRRPRLSVAFTILTALAVFRLVPLLGEGGPAATEGAARTRVVALNCLTSNQDVPAVAGWVEREAADVAVLLELDGRWMERLEGALPGYRRVPTDTARSDNFGMAVFVRDGLAWREPFVHHTERGLPWIEVLVEAPSGSLRVIAVHTIPPLAAGRFQDRNRQIADAVARATASAEPAVVAGDLNATIWSEGLRGALGDSGLRPACLGRGLRGTWPARLTFTGGILIDHVLVDPRLAVTAYRVGPRVGSDHLGVVVEIADAAR